MKTKIFAVMALVSLISLGAASFAGAQTTSTATSTATSSDSGHGKSLKLPGNRVEIGPSGEANIVGSVTAVSGNSLSIQSWGGTWNVAVATDTVVAGIGVKGDISQIKVGDVISVHGKMSLGSSLVLRAKVIKDFSLNKALSGAKKEVKDEIKKELKETRKEIKANFWERLRELLKNRKNSTSFKDE